MLYCILFVPFAESITVLKDRKVAAQTVVVDSGHVGVIKTQAPAIRSVVRIPARLVSLVAADAGATAGAAATRASTRATRASVTASSSGAASATTRLSASRLSTTIFATTVFALLPTSGLVFGGSVRRSSRALYSVPAVFHDALLFESRG
jgi:hypothetical protein